MVDSSDVLMLRPVYLREAYPALDAPRHGDAAMIAATVYPLAAPANDALAFFTAEAEPELAATGAPPVACFRSESAPNTFPALPVRTGESVLVWFARFADEAQHAAHLRALAASPAWTDDVLPRLSGYLAAPPQHLRLAPSARSQFR